MLLWADGNPHHVPLDCLTYNKASDILGQTSVQANHHQVDRRPFLINDSDNAYNSRAIIFPRRKQLSILS